MANQYDKKQSHKPWINIGFLEGHGSNNINGCQGHDNSEGP
jgi:hypothetical protein